MLVAERARSRRRRLRRGCGRRLASGAGPPLADVDDSVARPERAQLEEQRLAAVEQRIDADLELGRHAELVPELEALVARGPAARAAAAPS